MVVMGAAMMGTRFGGCARSSAALLSVEGARAVKKGDEAEAGPQTTEQHASAAGLIGARSADMQHPRGQREMMLRCDASAR